MDLPSPVSYGGTGTAALKSTPVPGRQSGPTRRSTKGGWTVEEDDCLARAVEQFKRKSWKKIAELFPGRTDVQCLHRWQKVLDPELIKGPWSKEEDDCIIELVQKHGCKKWSLIAKSLPGRIGKQCRERWHNHLNPAIKKDAWTIEEEFILIRAHQKHGNKWAEIAKLLPGRADNSIKNHWNCSVKKKLDSNLYSGLLGQTPRRIALDLNNDALSMENLKPAPETQNFSKPTSLDQQTRLGVGKTSSADSSHGITGRTHLGLQNVPNTSNHAAPSTHLRSRPPPCIGNESPCLQMQSCDPITEKLFTSPERSEGCAYARNDMAIVDMQINLNNHCKSDFTAGEINDTVGIGNNNQSPRTPTYSSDGGFGPFSCVPWQPSNLQEYLERERFTKIENHVVQTSSPFCSTSSDPSVDTPLNPKSPESILRKAAKSFNTPSIFRKRRHNSLGPSPVGNSEKVADTKDCYGYCDNSIQAESVTKALELARSDLCKSFNHTDNSSIDVSSVGQHPDSLKPKISVAMSSVEKRLEDVFNMETGTIVYNPLNATFGAGCNFNGMDSSHNSQERSKCLGYCRLMPESIATCD